MQSKSPQLSIRRATLEDVPVIVEHMNTILKEAAVLMCPAGTASTKLVESWLNEEHDELSEVWIAVTEDGKVVGMSQLSMFIKGWAAVSVSVLPGFRFKDSEARGVSLAETLIQRVKDGADQRLLDGLVACINRNNTPSKSLFLRSSFTESSRFKCPFTTIRPSPLCVSRCIDEYQVFEYEFPMY